MTDAIQRRSLTDAAESTSEPHAARSAAAGRSSARKEMADHLLVRALLAAAGPPGARWRPVASTRPPAASPRWRRRLSEIRTASSCCVFTAPPARYVPRLYELIALLAPLLGIAFGFDAVNSERVAGHAAAPAVPSRIYRDDVINGKFVAGLAVIAVIVSVVIALRVRHRDHAPGRRAGAPRTSSASLSWFLIDAAVRRRSGSRWRCSAPSSFRRAATAAAPGDRLWLVATFFATLIATIVAVSCARAADRRYVAERCQREDDGRRSRGSSSVDCVSRRRRGRSSIR